MRGIATLTLTLTLGLTGLACGTGETTPPAPPPQPSAAPPAPAKAPEAAKPAEPAATPAPAPEAIAKGILAYVDAFNGGKLDQAAMAFADDAQWTSAGSLVQPATGRAAIATNWQELRDIFDIKVSVARLFVTQDMWVAEGVLSGKHVGKFHGLAATNKPVGVDYVHVGWIENGKIKRLLSLSNGTAFTGQIGFSKGDLVPVAAAPGQPEVVLAAGDAQSTAAEEAIMAAMLKGDLGAWSATVAKDVVLRDRAAGKTFTGLEAAEKAASAHTSAFSDLKRDVKSFAAGPYVVSIGTTTGVHTKALGAIKPTGSTVTFHTVDVIKLKDGKAVEIELFHNPKEIVDALNDAAEAKAAAKPAAAPAKK